MSLMSESSARWPHPQREMARHSPFARSTKLHGALPVPTAAAAVTDQPRYAFLLERSRKMLLDPGVRTCEQLLPAARGRDSALALAIDGALAGIFYALKRPLVQGPTIALAEGAIGGAAAAIVLCGFAAIVLAGWARLLGGRGVRSDLAYLLALAFGPLAVVMSAAAIVPFLGPLVSIVLSLYGFALAMMAAMAAYDISVPRAFAAVFGSALTVALIFLALLPVLLVLAYLITALG